MRGARRALRHRGMRAGTATVELALVFPTLITLLFGIIEVGMLTRAHLALRNAANETARVAAVGASPTDMDACLATSLSGLDATQVTGEYQWRCWNVDTANWSEWAPLTSSDAGENSATEGSQVRVTLTYAYRLLTGGLFARMLHADENNAVTLSVTVVTTRE